jgi:hypothetical protein
MKLFTPPLAVSLLALSLLACVSNADQGSIDMNNKENRLMAAGFKQHPIKTEAQLADFRTIPAHMIRPATYKGKQVYIYADPTVCGCLYIGKQAAYQNFIDASTSKDMRQDLNATKSDVGFSAPWMLDGGAWDDADMYGLYLN